MSEAVKPLILKDEEAGKTYTLEFSRESVVFTNRQGFKPSEVVDNIEEMLPILFYGAFRMHHKDVSRHQTDKYLFEDLKGVSKDVFDRLCELYASPRNALVYEEKDERSENPKVALELM